jgi:hypothetical protein
VRTRLDPALQLLRAGTRWPVRDLERTETALADVARLEWIGGGALFALQGLCRHLSVVLSPRGFCGGSDDVAKPFTASPRLSLGA